MINITHFINSVTPPLGLQEGGPQYVNKKYLKEIVSYYEGRISQGLLKKENYEEEDWDSFAGYLSEASDLIDDLDATTQMVRTVISNLNDQFNSLRSIGVYPSKPIKAITLNLELEYAFQDFSVYGEDNVLIEERHCFGWYYGDEFQSESAGSISNDGLVTNDPNARIISVASNSCNFSVPGSTGPSLEIQVRHSSTGNSYKFPNSIQGALINGEFCSLVSENRLDSNTVQYRVQYTELGPTVTIKLVLND